MKYEFWRRSLLLILLLASTAAAGEPLPGTALLDPSRPDADVVAEHVRQVIGYFNRRIAEARQGRDAAWQPDFTSPEAYAKSIAPHRSACRKMLGLGDAKPRIAETEVSLVSATDTCRIQRLTIPISEGLAARGLLFLPTTTGRHPLVVVCPDATMWPEQCAGLEQGAAAAGWLKNLVDRGAAVYLPQSIERLADHPYSKTTNDKDRRLILHRLGYIVGRTMTGLDVDDTLAALDYLAGRPEIDAGRIGLVGVGQGGITALFAAGLDDRVRAAAVADAFQTHEHLCDEPADRRLPGQMLEFGDAELAAMVAPRTLVLVHPKDPPDGDRSFPDEARRASRFYERLGAGDRLKVVAVATPPEMLDAAIGQIAAELAMGEPSGKTVLPPAWVSEADIRALRDRHFEERLRYLRALIDASEKRRQDRWRLTTRPASEFNSVKSEMLADYRRLVGKVDTEGTPMRPRTDLVLSTEKYRAYRVMLDVTDGVEVYGHLLVPRDIQGRRPAVIAQHGLNGTPELVTGLGMTEDTVYHEFARRLAEHGYVVFAPFLAHHDPRKQINDQARLADAVGMMRVAVPVAKTQRVVDFLQSLPFVDPERIGYYGLSYGGYSALWIGPLVDRLSVVIPSGHFNDWRSKITADNTPISYLQHPDEDFYNWDVLDRFTHVELVTMMMPRPVCIEFGERDGITTPAWTAYAWNQLLAAGNQLSFADRIELAHYDGIHEIHGIETFDCLDRFLRPERTVGRDGRPFVTQILDGRKTPRISGRFWIARGAKELRGMAIKVDRVEKPGPVEIRFGTAPGKEDLGKALLEADSPLPEGDRFVPVSVAPRPVTAGDLVYFDIRVSDNASAAGHWVFRGPKPLGGTHWGDGFGLAYRVLTDRAEDAIEH
ncbi:MAG: prolyl oligopeptidase family serine peptidase [Planctomycetia bacterium]|nr:prolyl oligopeptidase family serine peptidase [Planctomycetia bacterium]